jgi:histidinol-phosphate aminotransferase
MGLKAIPSETNFVFVDLGVEAAGQCEELLHRGVIIRPLAWMGLPKGIRISVGTHEENEKCLEEMHAVFRKIESKA